MTRCCFLLPVPHDPKVMLYSSPRAVPNDSGALDTGAEWRHLPAALSQSRPVILTSFPPRREAARQAERWPILNAFSWDFRKAKWQRSAHKETDGNRGAACLESQEVRGGVRTQCCGLLPRDALALMHADAVLADASWMLGGCPVAGKCEMSTFWATPSRKQRLEPGNNPLKRRNLYKPVIFWLHVDLRGVSVKQGAKISLSIQEICEVQSGKKCLGSWPCFWIASWYTSFQDQATCASW